MASCQYLYSILHARHYIRMASRASSAWRTNMIIGRQSAAMSLAFWSEVCAESMKRSLSKQLELLHACSGVTIAAFCCCALASCFFFVQWARMDDSARRQLWNLHGAFTALMCFGSCAGSFTWVAKMQQLAYFYVSVDAGNKGSDKDRLFFAQQSSLSSQWAAAFHVGYALDFLCLSLAKLMVLDRMQHFAVSKSHDVQVRWSRARQMVIGAVVTCNLVGLGGNTASSVFFVQAARLFNDAASAFEASRSSDGLELIDRATLKQQQAEATESVQLFCEVVALIIIIAAFFAVGLLCVRLFKYALDLLHNAGRETELIGTATAQSHKLAQNATAEGKRLRRQIVSTIAVVFVTFLLRAVFSFMNAFADGFQNVSAACPACDGACHNVYTLIKYWILYTPEFRLLVVLISTPFTMMVALWGMTGARALEIIAVNRETKAQATQVRGSVL